MNKTRRISTVSANIKKKRLYITLQGIMSKKEVERLYTDIRFCVSDLDPGFAVITNLSECSIGHLNAIGSFRKIMHYLQEKEVGQIVRIVGKAKIIYLQMLKLSDKTKNYEPKYVKTPEEAEAYLDELASQNKLIA
jgi:hypothetical protein